MEIKDRYYKPITLQKESSNHDNNNNVNFYLIDKNINPAKVEEIKKCKNHIADVIPGQQTAVTSDFKIKADTTGSFYLYAENLLNFSAKMQGKL